VGEEVSALRAARALWMPIFVPSSVQNPFLRPKIAIRAKRLAMVHLLRLKLLPHVDMLPLFVYVPNVARAMRVVAVSGAAPRALQILLT
jgi:hypothetical protein